MVDETPFDDKFHEECGVFGVYDHKDASALVALGLHALQHRGQEAAGIVSYERDQDHFHAHRDTGLVGDIFGSEKVIEQLPGNFAMGHNRYSTAGGSGMRNIQPFFADFDFGGLALAHNGNLTNALTLREQMVKKGTIFYSTSDTEVIVHLVAMSRAQSVTDRVVEALKQVEGGYSLVVMSKDGMIGVRDPHGVRPLCLGRLGEAYILASESCAFDIIGATYIRDVQPGEMIVVNKDGLHSYHPFIKQPSRFCIFEYVYFSRPDSVTDGRSVYEMRKKIGMELAKEEPVDVDVVVPVPDSGVPGAIGYAQQSGMPFELGIIRNHYVGRTFIEPTDHIRHLGVKLKHNANKVHIEGKRVVLVDDSIVRGTTSRKIVEMVRQAGAKEVHMRIASPPTISSCYYGVDTPDKNQLLAAKHSVAEMCKIIGADSLAFLSADGMYRALGEKGRNKDAPQFCDACFTGDYPIKLTDLQGENFRQSQLTLITKKT